MWPVPCCYVPSRAWRVRTLQQDRQLTLDPRRHGTNRWRRQQLVPLCAPWQKMCRSAPEATLRLGNRVGRAAGTWRVGPPASSTTKPLEMAWSLRWASLEATDSKLADLDRRARVSPRSFPKVLGGKERERVCKALAWLPWKRFLQQRRPEADQRWLDHSTPTLRVQLPELPRPI